LHHTPRLTVPEHNCHGNPPFKPSEVYPAIAGQSPAPPTQLRKTPGRGGKTDSRYLSAEARGISPCRATRGAAFRRGAPEAFAGREMFNSQQSAAIGTKADPQASRRHPSAASAGVGEGGFFTAKARRGDEKLLATNGSWGAETARRRMGETARERGNQ
jgi:hypothetical protein